MCIIWLESKGANFPISAYVRPIPYHGQSLLRRLLPLHRHEHPQDIREQSARTDGLAHRRRTYCARTVLSAADAECRQATRNGMRLGCGEMDLEEKKVVDPVIRAARMSLEDVVRELREEEGVWFEGVDWSERRGMREQKPRRKYGGEDGRKKIHRPVAVGHHPGRQSRRCCRHRR
ncbi:hypothetical protein C8F01DRAFT_556842 [Mycena amicta]|nr:hypothetical protein C8F01DRAFT_556842 [Mycena amicta]